MKIVHKLSYIFFSSYSFLMRFFQVYWAEKVTSLGKDWHRGCLRCAHCKKTLTPGSHSEHAQEPYCSRPCYATLFGPKGLNSASHAEYTGKKPGSPQAPWSGEFAQAELRNVYVAFYWVGKNSRLFKFRYLNRKRRIWKNKSVKILTTFLSTFSIGFTLIH